MTVYEWYDMPPGRTPESFRYHVSFLWGEQIVEDYFTDDPADRDRLISGGVEQEYGVRVLLGPIPTSPASISDRRNNDKE